MKKIFIITVLLIAISGSLKNSLAAEIRLEKEIKNIPAKITELYNCGKWENKKGNGFYRIIYIDFYYGNSLLYVQWVQDFSSNNKERHIKHTLSIKELNANDHIELTFNKPKCTESDSGIKLNIIASSGHDEKKHVFDLKINNEFGKYQFKEVKLR